MPFGANLAYASQTVSGQGLLVSGSYFPLLGVQPLRGRLLEPEDDRGAGNPVVVLGYGYWVDTLGSDPNVLTSIEGGHYGNFIEAIRANDPKILTCDILEGHLSATLPHLANIAYREPRCGRMPASYMPSERWPAVVPWSERRRS